MVLSSDARAARPLVGRRGVPPLVALAVLGAGVTALVGLRVAGGDNGLHVDRLVTTTLAEYAPMRHGFAALAGKALAGIGSPLPVVVCLIALAVLATVFRGRRGLALVLVGPAVAMATTSVVLKPWVDRTRGYELAYPSGHTTAVASMAVAAALLVLSSTMRPVARGGVLAGLAGLVLAVVVALVARGVHFPTDTLGGLGVAVAVVPVVALVVDLAAGTTRADRSRGHEGRPDDLRNGDDSHRRHIVEGAR